MDREIFLKDGGYKSRKFWLAVIAMVLIIVSSLICPTVSITDIVAGIVAICTVYVGGNAVTRWSTGKVLAQSNPPPEPASNAPSNNKEEGA